MDPRRLENEDEEKFWEAWIKDELTFCYRFGKIGSPGGTKLKKFKTAAEAQAELEEKLQQKLAEGFVELGAEKEEEEEADDEEADDDEADDEEADDDEADDDEADDDGADEADDDEADEADDDEPTTTRPTTTRTRNQTKGRSARSPRRHPRLLRGRLCLRASTPAPTPRPQRSSRAP